MATKSRSRTSVRAQRFWDRLVGWYGTRLTDQYGLNPPDDWCQIVDDHDNDTVAAALGQIKTRHPQYPPSFPEVDAVFVKLRPSAGPVGPSIKEQLCDFVLRHRSLTRTQQRLPWTYIGRTFDAPGLDGKMRSNHGVEITGVIVPADGDQPGYRVMVVDMQLEDAA